jgi:hypothetical protein
MMLSLGHAHLVLRGAGKALELVGDSVKAHYLLATALSNLGRLDEAEGSFKVPSPF